MLYYLFFPTRFEGAWRSTPSPRPPRPCYHSPEKRGKIKLVFMQAALDLDKLWGAEVDFPTSWAYKIFSTRSASKDFLCFLRLKESERAREGPTTHFPFALTSRTGNKKRRTLIKSSAEDVGTDGEDLWRGVKLRLSHCLKQNHMANRH